MKRIIFIIILEQLAYTMLVSAGVVLTVYQDYNSWLILISLTGIPFAWDSLRRIKSMKKEKEETAAG